MRTYKLGMGGLFCLATWFGCSSIVELDRPYKPETKTDQGSSSGEIGGSGGSAGTGGVGGQAGMGGSAMVCAPGSTEPCYDGPPESEGLGACHAGVRICNVAGTAYGECTNQVTPNAEDCKTPIDDDCNGVVNDLGSMPVLAMPGIGETVPGGSVTLEWTGGSAPYQVELAFDAAFTDPVTSIPPILAWDTTVTVDGLNGGYFYWRVRSLGGCGSSEFTEARELHVTCRPINLAGAPTVDEGGAGLAWNEYESEYGIVFQVGPDGSLAFMRVDRLGNTVFGPVKLAGSSLPAIQNGYQSPDVAYISSTDQWAVVYHREGADQAFVSLFDDVGKVLRTIELDDAGDSEFQSIAYHTGSDRIITTNDHAAGVWDTYVHVFDHDLNLVAPVINATMGNGNSGVGASLILLDGISGSGGAKALFSFFRDEWDPSLMNDVMAQVVDVDANTTKWPVGSYSPQIAGKPVAVNAGVRQFVSAAWNAENQVVGIGYNSNTSGEWNSKKNVYFTLFDPIAGVSTIPPVHLNAATPLSSLCLTPKVAWDGEEFLVAWNDARELGNYSHLRLTKLDVAGQLKGVGDYRYPHDGWRVGMAYWQPRSLIGHDRLHVLAYDHSATETDHADLWLCIEPPYK